MTLERKGLRISKSKVEYEFGGREQKVEVMTINGDTISQVKSFKY